MERGQPNNQLMDMLKLLQINMAMKNKQEQERKKQRRSSYPSNKYQSRSGMPLELKVDWKTTNHI